MAHLHCNSELWTSAMDLEKNGDMLSRRSSSSQSSLCSVDSDDDDDCHPLSPPPKTVILGIWPGPRLKQIEYYVQGYESLYPTSKVLLLYSKPSTQDLERILDHVSGDSEKRSFHFRQGVLIHLFGDDAATQVCRLLRAYRARTDRTLGVKAIVLDSVPVVVAPSLRSLRASPLLLLTFICLTLTSVFWRFLSVLTFWFSEPYGEQVREDFNDPRLLPPTAKRCYIFPERDVMFAWDRQDCDGEACERQHFEVKRQCVDWDQQSWRWTGNQERYWLGIEDAWEG